jgi:putative SbcD/Mre11-related phosphoesterase
MLLRNPLGRKRRVGGPDWGERRLFDQVHGHDPDFVLLRQALREVRSDWCDAAAARAYAERLPGLTVRCRYLSQVSPFAENWTQAAVGESEPVETPAEALRRLHAELVGEGTPRCGPVSSPAHSADRRSPHLYKRRPSVGAVSRSGDLDTTGEPEMLIHGDWLLTGARAAIHRPTATAVVADLHLGYAQARHRGGEAVPSRPLAEIFAPLLSLLSSQTVSRLVIAGDLFETRPRPTLIAELLGCLRAVAVELLGVVPGNHDRGLAASSGLPLCPEGTSIGGWRIVHGDGPLPEPPLVQGHEHPCVRWPGLAAPCYLIGAGRLVLPAFSADAAGVNVRGDARWQTFRCAVIAGDQVLDFGPVGALPRAPQITPTRSVGGRGSRRAEG